MNAFNTVNLAAACILTSVEFAKEMEIPEERWIYPLGGAGTAESNDCEYGLASAFSYADNEMDWPAIFT